MRFGQQIITLENLRKFTHISSMDGRIGWDTAQQNALLKAIADSHKESYIGCIADAFGIENPQNFSIGDLVKIIALPSSLVMDEVGEEIRSFATSYGYIAVVEGRGLYGADIYFIDHGGLALASAAEMFSKLKLLGSAY